MSIKLQAKEVLKEVKKNGMLFVHDFENPSVTSIIAGEAIKGSWWGHKKGNLIYNSLDLIFDSKEIIGVKLINGKLTIIHKELWNDFFTIVSRKRDWQVNKLCLEAIYLLGHLKGKPSLRSDKIEWPKKRKLGDVIRELEKKLLIYCGEVHTESGAHAKVILSWNQFQKELKFKRQPTKLSLAYGRIEGVVTQFSGKTKLPW